MNKVTRTEMDVARARMADILLAEAADKRSIELANEAADALERAGLRNLASVVRAHPEDRGWVAPPDPDVWEEFAPQTAEDYGWSKTDEEPDPRLSTTANIAENDAESRSDPTSPAYPAGTRYGLLRRANLEDDDR